MPLLVGKSYDPATAVTYPTVNQTQMSLLDNVNLRATFNAPDSGNVLVRIQVPMSGAATFPQIFLGVMENFALVKRVAPRIDVSHAAANSIAVAEAIFTVTGLAPGSAHNYDAAMAVSVGVAGTALRWGGPNDAGLANAWGAFIYEIWSA